LIVAAIQRHLVNGIGKWHKRLQFVVRALAPSETIKIRGVAVAFLDLVVNGGDKRSLADVNRDPLISNQNIERESLIENSVNQRDGTTPQTETYMY